MGKLAQDENDEAFEHGVPRRREPPLIVFQLDDEPGEEEQAGEELQEPQPSPRVWVFASRL